MYRNKPNIFVVNKWDDNSGLYYKGNYSLESHYLNTIDRQTARCSLQWTKSPDGHSRLWKLVPIGNENIVANAFCEYDASKELYIYMYVVMKICLIVLEVISI